MTHRSSGGFALPELLVFGCLIERPSYALKNPPLLYRRRIVRHHAVGPRTPGHIASAVYEFVLSDGMLNHLFGIVRTRTSP